MSAILDEDQEFQRNWSTAGGRHHALKEMVDLIMQRAGEAFSLGHDTEAQALRTMAREIAARRDTASRELSDFIAEDRKRRSYA